MYITISMYTLNPFDLLVALVLQLQEPLLACLPLGMKALLQGMAPPLHLPIENKQSDNKNSDGEEGGGGSSNQQRERAIFFLAS